MKNHWRANGPGSRASSRRSASATRSQEARSPDVCLHSGPRRVLFGPYHSGMSISRNALRIGCVGLLVLSALYCLPGHPSAGHVGLLDAAVHAGLFLGVGLWFGLSGARGVRVFLGLAIFAALLEVVQSVVGHFAIEWPDIGANEAGLAIAWLALFLLPRTGEVAEGG